MGLFTAHEYSPSWLWRYALSKYAQLSIIILEALFTDSYRLAPDKLYVVGGSDGTQSLCTTEVFDFETNSWSPGPSMTCCRANISVTVIDGKLFAVGGFSGERTWVIRVRRAL